jgi:hypothetical protein
MENFTAPTIYNVTLATYISPAGVHLEGPDLAASVKKPLLRLSRFPLNVKTGRCAATLSAYNLRSSACLLASNVGVFAVSLIITVLLRYTCYATYPSNKTNLLVGLVEITLVAPQRPPNTLTCDHLLVERKK